jgi:hypothetical protein
MLSRSVRTTIVPTKRRSTRDEDEQAPQQRLQHTAGRPAVSSARRTTLSAGSSTWRLTPTRRGVSLCVAVRREADPPSGAPMRGCKSGAGLRIATRRRPSGGRPCARHTQGPTAGEGGSGLERSGRSSPVTGGNTHRTTTTEQGERRETGGGREGHRGHRWGGR